MWTVAQGALELGLIFAIMAVGIYLSFRVLNIPDLTIDGSFTLGSAVAGSLAVAGHPALGVLLSLGAGALAGCVTGFLQTKLRVQPILAGILTMTALYSVNLRVMGQKPNVSLFGKAGIFSVWEQWLPAAGKLILIALLVLAVFSTVHLFLKTELGLSLRATGDNEFMVRASSINSDAMKILGLALANALVSLSGAVLAQYQQFSDAGVGNGMMVVGLASIIVGETLIGRGPVWRGLLAAVAGAVVYRIILTAALNFGMPAGDLKLLSALLVAAAISIPVIRGAIQKRRSRRA